MFIQGIYPSKLPHSPRQRGRRPFQRPMTADAQRLRLLLKLVDVKTQTEMMMRDFMKVSADTAIQAASLVQRAFIDVYVRMQRLLKTSTEEIISTIDAQNRFQRFMGSASSILHESSENQRKFDALESELKMLKEQMALLIQGQMDIPNNQSGKNTHTERDPHNLQNRPSVPTPPPAPPCPLAYPPPSSKLSIPGCSTHTISFLDELICSDVSESEGEEFESIPLKSQIPGMQVSSRSLPRSNRFRSRETSDYSYQNRPSFAEQIQAHNRSGLRKTRIDRSPGGTPLKQNAMSGSEGFHNEILANALFRKFQNARADESPERRHRQAKYEKNDPLCRNGNGLAALFEGEVQDDEWSDKENS